MAANLPPFQTLVDAHADAVARFLRGMVGRDAAEDLLQETFLAALRAYPGFDGAKPRAWLLAIARNKAIDESRSAARRPVALAESDEIPGVAASPRDDASLWSAVAELPPKQRAAIVLRYALDLRYRDVGEAIGCSEEAARRSVHEGLKSLRSSESIEEVRA